MTNLNFTLYEEWGLQDQDLIYIFAAKEINKSKLETIPQDVLERLETLSILKRIKGTKSENPLHKLRISEKAKKLFFTPKYTNEEEVLFDWLSKYYLSRGKEVGHPERVKNLLLWFKQETGIEKNNLVTLIQHFLNSEGVDENSRVLEYCLYFPKKISLDGKTIAYITTPDIHDSWLYRHYIRNRAEIDRIFEERSKKD